MIRGRAQQARAAHLRTYLGRFIQVVNPNGAVMVSGRLRHLDNSLAGREGRPPGFYAGNFHIPTRHTAPVPPYVEGQDPRIVIIPYGGKRR